MLYRDEIPQKLQRRSREIPFACLVSCRGPAYWSLSAVDRQLFQRLDGWIRRRIWSHRYRRWRNVGWKRLPVPQLYGEYELVRLIDLIPSLASRRR